MANFLVLLSLYYSQQTKTFQPKMASDQNDQTYWRRDYVWHHKQVSLSKAFWMFKTAKSSPRSLICAPFILRFKTLSEGKRVDLVAHLHLRWIEGIPWDPMKQEHRSQFFRICDPGTSQKFQRSSIISKRIPPSSGCPSTKTKNITGNQRQKFWRSSKLVWRHFQHRLFAQCPWRTPKT